MKTHTLISWKSVGHGSGKSASKEGRSEANEAGTVVLCTEPIDLPEVDA